MLAFDVRVMNNEKGFCFVPGIDLGLTYSPGMTALMTAKLPPQVQVEFVTFGERFTADALKKHGVVYRAVPSAEVLPTAIRRASALKAKSKHRDTMRSIKESLYCEALAALECKPNEMFLDPHFQAMGFQAVAPGQDRPPGLESVLRTTNRHPTTTLRVSRGMAPVPTLREVPLPHNTIATNAVNAGDLPMEAARSQSQSYAVPTADVHMQDAKMRA